MNKEKFKKNMISQLNKLKKSFKKIFNNFKKFCIKLWNMFLELPKKSRIIILVWIAILAIILLIICFSNNTNKFYDKYATFENNISTKALRYVEENDIFTTKDNKLVINLEILQQENYVTTDDISDKTCEGISVVYYDDAKDEYVVDTYLNCEKYTSKNYWDYK